MRVTDRAWLRERLRAAPALHLYELGDLDDFFWPHTRWYAHRDAIALVYAAGDAPVLIALGDVAQQGPLLEAIRDELPSRIYAHLSPGLLGALAPRFVSAPHGAYRKMLLAERKTVAAVDTAGVEALAPRDADEVAQFYARAYPGNWFDPRMLETGQYVALREGGELVAAGGVHVFSRVERVAALGNIAVAPEARGRGLATRLTARLCTSLSAFVDDIGLNVRADNDAAIACYLRLGFTHVAPYEEHMLHAPAPA